MSVIKEDFESTTSIGTGFNPLSDLGLNYPPVTITPISNMAYSDQITNFPKIDVIETEPEEIVADVVTEPVQSIEPTSVYEDLEALGFVFLLASNDVHTIHINAKGENFTELHLAADDIYNTFNSYGDHCLEISCEDGHFIHSINEAMNFVNWNICNCGQTGYTLESGVNEICRILDDVALAISELYNDVNSDIQSVMDEWIRYIDSKKNYFLGRILQESKKRIKKSSKKESMMLRNTRHNRKKGMCEHLDYLQLGKSYKMFCQVEDHIEDYDCDTVTLKEGDYIVRDFQFGHLPNGGNKGYIPYKVMKIEYDRDEDKGGYWDARKRLHLYDGEEDFYIECYNERFNGMFHKLKKSSVKE